MRIATAAYPMDPIESWDAWTRKARTWVAEACAGPGADLLVFPEYGAMELAYLDGAAAAADLETSLHAAARHGPRAQEVWAELAVAHGCHILAPSSPWEAGRDRPVNRAWLHGPGGTLGYQDKQVMTRFERDPWGVVPGDPLRLFEIDGLKIGVLICYDVEFPALGQALIAGGADLILAPSCTDTVAGFHRVRIGAMARALEGQCVTVHSPTVGACDWSPAVDENHGRAAIYAPPDLGFPETGIVSEGGPDIPGWVRAEIDPAAIARVRQEGSVGNRADWAEAATAAARME
ncbi:carbon-nitrogen hydrolase family protein [uncultured Jannaschia sp.]|uniref:carbon-nitrogen hydrolase family protein n=1 Tax=uncultured Jannaschia sp. TaxID=293347 RepID=UPI002624D37A|nr:carbon-nitrogen hydrolase family protein [uncultured Jannaschia sp.]